MILPNDAYASSVKQVLNDLRENEGCKEVEVKNYWSCLTYRGINTVLQAPSGTKFELQFHTEESFLHKQNKTHILYEALRREEDPVKQNLFFSDMSAMWDAVKIPPGADCLGTARGQTPPQRKPLTEQEQVLVDRVLGLKQLMRDNINALRDRVRSADPLIAHCVEYAAKLYNFSMKDLEGRFKSTILVTRKVEEELRRKARISISTLLHEVDMPKKIDGMPFAKYLSVLCFRQADALLYKLVTNDEAAYSRGAIGIIDVMAENGFIIRGVENYWADLEKHHAVSVTLEVPVGHPVVPACRFKLEFHTEASYATSIERRAALSHVENRMYEKGEAFNKAAADMQVRFDATLIRSWAKVAVPPGALSIGHSVELDTDRSGVWKLETETIRPWLTPAQRRKRLLGTAGAVGIFLLGLIGGMGATYAATKRYRR